MSIPLISLLAKLRGAKYKQNNAKHFLLGMQGAWGEQWLPVRKSCCTASNIVRDRA